MNKIASRWLASAIIGLLACGTASVAFAQPKEVKPLQQWKGSLDNREVMKAAGEVVTSQAEFEKLWKAWRAGEKAPAVDFAKEIALVHTTVGSVLNVRAMLDDKGDLRALAMGTKDLRPGFRYVISTVSREGVKTVNGQALPAAAAGGAAKVQLPKPGEVTWEELKLVIKEGKVLSVMQAHSRRVTVMLEGNQQYHATEPKIDDVIKYIRELGKNVPIATE